ncbi:hypothetical protein WG68_11910 [Arsukibacterium ikkense]|uniref:Carboxysome shell carbonic anhydrase n=1 Tax=Arsukibacterium ikkense TaxID=336831 RepID=A0A0M2V6C6_9GAMM|nr:hypothetical protein [Arsukibacterium ikkense]KKO45210.1 hypothetical protein WG68_11910 [Arsukibacterium ikkense]
MQLYQQPIAQRIAWLEQLGQAHSSHFLSAPQQQARAQYQAAHPSAIVALKCMDGRLHLPVATQTPQGIIQPFRNLGGIFDLGWPYLGDLIADTVCQAERANRPVLVLITYHFSRGSKARGCAGFNCSKTAALAAARQLQQQFRQLYPDLSRVYPLVCGFETDSDGLLIHGGLLPDDQAILDLTCLTPDTTIAPLLQQLLPDMSARLQADLLPLLQGNLAHIAEIHGSKRPLAQEHREWMLCIGRGFDFLHVPNTALIIGPFSPDLTLPLRQAAAIIAANMQQRRIPDDGALLLASVPYQQAGGEQRRATLKATFLANFAMATVQQHQPQLAEKLYIKTATLHWPSQQLEFFSPQ